MNEASMLGSPQAQFYLGNRYQKGEGVSPDLDRARRLFRLCAAQGISTCQYRLASLILEIPNRLERDLVEAIAWLQLAAAQNLPEAKAMLDREMVRSRLPNWIGPGR